MCERTLGPEHLKTADSYNNIGLIYHFKGDFGQALDYHQKSLANREKILGPEHPDIAASFNNIGLIYNYKGDHDKALE